MSSPPFARMRLAFVLDGVRADVLARHRTAEEVLIDVDAFDASLG